MKDLAYVTCEKSWLTLQLGAEHSTIRCCKIRSRDDWNHLMLLQTRKLTNCFVLLPNPIFDILGWL